MKLSFSFLSATLLVPFSEATVALTERWTIGNVTAPNAGNFHYAGMSKTWLDTLSSDNPNGVVRATFYNGDCKVEGLGVGQGNNTPFYAVAGFGSASLSPTIGAGGESAFDNITLAWAGADRDNTSKEILNLSFNDHARVMTDMGDFSSETLDDGTTLVLAEGTLKYCVRLGLYAGGTSIEEINFYESVVTLNITMNGTFEILSVGVAPKAQGESTAAQEYTVSASLCDAEGVAYDQGDDEKFNQGAAIVVCINLDEAGLADQVEITSVDEFTWTRDGTSDQTAVGNPGDAGFDSDGLANNGLTMMTMNADKNKAIITSVLFAKFYESAGQVLAEGSVTMAFGAATAGAAEAGGGDGNCASGVGGVTGGQLSLSEQSFNDGELIITSQKNVSPIIPNLYTVENDILVGQADFSAVGFTAKAWYDAGVCSLNNQAWEVRMDFSFPSLQTLAARGNNFEQNWNAYQYLMFDQVATTLDQWDDVRMSLSNGHSNSNGNGLTFIQGPADFMSSVQYYDTPFSWVVSRDAETGYLNLKLYRDTDNLLVEAEVRRNVAFSVSDLMDNSRVPFSMYINGMIIDWEGFSLTAGARDTSRRRRLDGPNRRLGGNNNNDNRRRHLQDGGTAEAGFEISAELQKADDGPVALQQTAGTGVGTSITVVATIVGLVSAILLA